MFTNGDLIWIPQETVLLIRAAQNPQAIKITQKPEVGIFLSSTDEDPDFVKVIADGREWITNKKNIMHLRRKNVSKIN